MKKRGRKRKRVAPFPLKQMLARLGWSQRRLAAAADINLSQINQIANGKGQPTWPTILRIATTVGADLGDLQPGKDGAA